MFTLLISGCFVVVQPYVQAADIPDVNLFFSPAQLSVIEGSTFQVSLYLDTNESSVGAMDVFLEYPQELMEIVSPSAGQSLIQLWLQPAQYSNTQGTAHLTGVVPNGIVTESGLITTITFRALASGEGDVKVLSTSQVLANDGLGTVAKTTFGRVSLEITPKPPAGVQVFSDTHPFENEWYQDKTVVLGWEGNPEVQDYSYSFDTSPSTIPDDTPDSVTTSAVFADTQDGLHYFHIRARRQGVWGPTTHFLVRIDSLAPAAFTPDMARLSDGDPSRRLISFSTTDSLSGLDHYEVGVIDMSENPNVSPVFVQTESPFQFTAEPTHRYRVVTRAVDGAGNVRDGSVDIEATEYRNLVAWFIASIREYVFIIVSGLLALLVAAFSLHYLIGHHVYRRLKALVHIFTHVEDIQKLEHDFDDARHKHSD